MYQSNGVPAWICSDVRGCWHSADPHAAADSGLFRKLFIIWSQELKFGIGDGKLNYYLYNWRVQREMAPQQVGLVLL